MGRLSEHLGAHKEQLEVYPENRYIGALESAWYLQYYRMYKSGGSVSTKEIGSSGHKGHAAWLASGLEIQEMQ
jgi:hypothetical protein